MFSYVLRDLVRNPRRTLASVAGVALAVGLFSGISVFVDSSAAQMTARAIAPVTIDMQAGVNSPLASSLVVTETMSPARAAVGQRVTVTLTATNGDTRPATATVVKDTPPAQLTYVAGSTVLRGTPVADVLSGDPPLSSAPLSAGLAVGTLAPGGAATITYMATVAAALPAAGTLPLAGTVQSVENPAPVVANGQPATDLPRVLKSIRATPGVEGAQLFGLADLPPGSLRRGTAVINAPLKVVAFDPSYLGTFPVVAITSGALASGSAAISQPAADLLGATAGTRIPLQLSLPGQKTAQLLTVSAVADFTQASQLFLSRSPDTQGEFVGAPYVLVVDISTFVNLVIPALRVDAAAPAPVVKSPPVLEVHAHISRQALAADPTTAGVRTAGLRRTIERVAPGEVTVIDNLSDALTKARIDTILAKVLFIFLGVPGVLLAAYLSRYAGSLLAQAQRRERATLRARGIRPAALLRALAYGTAAVALLGSVLGLALSALVTTLLFRGAAALQVSGSAYLSAAGLALGAALITTTVALYLPGRRALLREVVEERREIDTAAHPAWLRIRLDLVLLALAALVGLITYLTGGYKPAPTAEAQSVSLSFYVLLAPLLFWVGATLLAVRLLLLLAGRFGRRAVRRDFRHGLVRRSLALSVLRRPQAVTSGVIALTLAVAFGVSLLLFVTTYQAEKLADGHFVVGGDVRVTAGAPQPGAGAITDQLRVPGVQQATPLATSTLTVGTDKRTLVAIDPSTFEQVAHINPSFLLGGATPERSMAALAADPNAVLVDQEIAKTFNVQVGDPVKVQVPNAVTGKPTPATFKAVAMFTRFPGFPPGIDFVTNLSSYQAVSATTSPNFYLLSTDGTDATNAAVVAAIKAGPGRTTPLQAETTATAVNKEQSTLSALNLTGLGRLEVLYTLLMTSLGITIFVFGLLLQRRKEHVTMRALGMRMRDLQGLIAGEAGLVAALSLVVGGLVGTGMALQSVQILQPVFTVPPAGLTLPWPTLAIFVALVAGATLLASAIAGQTLRRAHLVEILREE